MRVSRERAEQNRQTVIDTASRLFREHGFDGIGVSDLMKGAGLTQGGFYKQFASKEDLIEKASQRAVEFATRQWDDAVAARSEEPIEAIVEFYLSPKHRADKSDGCPLAALGSDAARRSSGVKASFETGIRSHIDVIGSHVSGADEAAPNSRAIAMLSLFVGALTLSRVVEDENLSQAFLDVAGNHARELADLPTSVTANVEPDLALKEPLER